MPAGVLLARATERVTLRDATVSIAVALTASRPVGIRRSLHGKRRRQATTHTGTSALPV
jgi:hypothetical protein